MSISELGRLNVLILVYCSYKLYTQKRKSMLAELTSVRDSGSDASVCNHALTLHTALVERCAAGRGGVRVAGLDRDTGLETHQRTFQTGHHSQRNIGSHHVSKSQHRCLPWSALQSSASWYLSKGPCKHYAVFLASTVISLISNVIIDSEPSNFRYDPRCMLGVERVTEDCRGD